MGGGQKKPKKFVMLFVNDPLPKNFGAKIVLKIFLISLN